MTDQRKVERRTQADLDRIAAAREHYRTRAARRQKGMSRADKSVYDDYGRRLRPALTAYIRHNMAMTDD